MRKFESPPIYVQVVITTLVLVPVYLAGPLHLFFTVMIFVLLLGEHFIGAST